jgi:hypothetical protein
MSRKRGTALLAAALLGSALAGTAFFYGKRLRPKDLEQEQDYRLGRLYLARGLAIVIALGLFVKAATDADDDEP